MLFGGREMEQHDNVHVELRDLRRPRGLGAVGIPALPSITHINTIRNVYLPATPSTCDCPVSSLLILVLLSRKC